MITAAAAATSAPPEYPGGAALTLFVIIAAVVGWIALRSLVRSLRARKTETTVGGRFADYALEALVNASKLDGRINDAERAAVARAMGDMGGQGFDNARVDAAFANATLNKDELVAYLLAKSNAFSRDQKTALLKALLTVFAADGRFDEAEHAALVDYTAAVGFDRQSAPQMLRGLARDLSRGNIT